MKEGIPQLAKRLVEETLIISKPMHYPSIGKELEQKHVTLRVDHKGT